MVRPLGLSMVNYDSAGLDAKHDYNIELTYPTLTVKLRGQYHQSASNKDH